MLNHSICVSTASQGPESTYRLEFLGHFPLRPPSHPLPMGSGAPCLSLGSDASPSMLNWSLGFLLHLCWITPSFLTVIHSLLNALQDGCEKSISIEALRGLMLFYGVNPDGDILKKVMVEQCSIFRNKKRGMEMGSLVKIQKVLCDKRYWLKVLTVSMTVLCHRCALEATPVHYSGSTSQLWENLSVTKMSSVFLFFFFLNASYP